MSLELVRTPQVPGHFKEGPGVDVAYAVRVARPAEASAAALDNAAAVFNEVSRSYWEALRPGDVPKPPTTAQVVQAPYF